MFPFFRNRYFAQRNQNVLLTRHGLPPDFGTRVSILYAGLRQMKHKRMPAISLAVSQPAFNCLLFVVFTELWGFLCFCSLNRYLKPSGPH